MNETTVAAINDRAAEEFFKRGSALVPSWLAFATVGLSSGLTEAMPDPAKYVMAGTMLMGRVGTVTLAAAVAATSRTQLYSLPVERPIVG